MSAVKEWELPKILWLLSLFGLLAVISLIYLAPVVAQETPGTTVEIDPPQVEATTGDIITLDIVVRNITDPEGLGAYVVRIGFDGAVVKPVDVLGGSPPFNGGPVFNLGINPISIVGIQGVTIPGPKGDQVIARLKVMVTGSPGDETSLEIDMSPPSGLRDANGNPIGSTGVSGRITVVAPVQATLTPTATTTPVATIPPTQTPIPSPTATPVPTATPISTSTPSPTPAPSPTETPLPTPMPTPIPTPTPSPTATPSPMPTPKPTATSRPTATPTQTVLTPTLETPTLAPAPTIVAICRPSAIMGHI